MSQQNQIVDEGKFLYIEVYLAQQSPAFLAPGTGFVEDNFSMEVGAGGGFQMIQAHSSQAHLLLCGPVPNRHRLVPVHGPEVGDPVLASEKKRWNMELAHHHFAA